MPIKDITCDTSVTDLVTYVELSSIQYAFGWNSWVSTRAASQLWNMKKKKKKSIGKNTNMLVSQGSLN